MAGLKRMHAFSLPLFYLFIFSLHFAEGHRKLSPSKLPNRVLMGAHSSSPLFYNAFDTSFQNPGSMYTNDLNSKESLNSNDNINRDESSSHYKEGFDKGLSSTNYAFFPSTYNTKYDSNENFADPSSDYKANEGKYPTFSPYGHKFPTSFEASFTKKGGYGKESPSFDGQQGFYNTPSTEKTLYASSSNEESLYTSPSTSKNLYTSPFSVPASHDSSPSNYKASFPFNANNSPSMPKVSEFDEFTKSQPVSNYDSFFNTPTINKNLGHTSTLGHPTFPMSDHDLTYGQVQVP